MTLFTCGNVDPGFVIHGSRTSVYDLIFVGKDLFLFVLKLGLANFCRSSYSYVGFGLYFTCLISNWSDNSFLRYVLLK